MAKKYKIILFSFFLAIFPVFASAATLSISPSSATVEVGNTFTVRVVVSSTDSVNAVSADVLFPPSLFSIQSVSKSGSILNFWVTEPSFKKSTGVAHFEGVALNGFQGSSVAVLTVTLKAVTVGTGKVSFQTGQILANDGQGTDITGSLSQSGVFTVKPASKKSVLEPLVSEPIVNEQPVEPKTPEIISGTKYGAQSVVGTSGYIKKQVVVTFLANNGEKVFVTGVSDPDGSFNIVVPGSLKGGAYAVTAVVVRDDRTNSETSNIIMIQVGGAFSSLPQWTLFLILLLVLTIVYLLLRVFRHSNKNKNINKDLKHKIENVEKIVSKSFEILRDDIHDYEREKLSVAEHKIIAEIKKDITDAEQVITKEIKNIESV